MAEYWVVNGHQPDCAYMRSLRDDQQDECDCRDMDDDAINDEVYADGDYGW